jgi:hypothetical protein
MKVIYIVHFRLTLFISRILSFSTLPAGGQTIIVIIECYAPTGVGAAIGSFSGLFADVVHNVSFSQSVDYDMPDETLQGFISTGRRQDLAVDYEAVFFEQSSGAIGGNAA